MTPAKPLLLVAATTGYQTRMFTEAAAGLGLEVVLATDRCHVLEDPWGDRALPIRFEHPVAAVEAVKAAGEFQGIVALGDGPSWVAAVIGQRLGIPFHPPAAVATCRSKFTMRECFRQAGLPVPEYRLVAVDADVSGLARGMRYPCVLKPLGLSASRGVIRADSTEQFLEAFARIQAILRLPEIARERHSRNEFIQVEDFIPGREFALEGLMTEGRFEVLALFEKPEPLDGPFFEETIYVTPSREPSAIQASIADTTRAAVRAIGLRHGPVHAEMRVNERGVWMLEVAARPIGGLCARVLPGLPELLLRHAAGDSVSAPDLAGLASGVMMIPIPREGIFQGVSGVDEAREITGIEDVAITAKPGQNLTPLPEGNSYLGFIFARAGSPQEVQETLLRAHARLRFDVTAALNVLAPRG